MKKETEKAAANKTAMRKRNFILPMLLITQLAVIGWLVIKEQKSTSYKIAYIEVSKVYDGFTLTKKLNAEFESIQKAKEGQLDTLKLQLGRLEAEIRGGNTKRTDEYNYLMTQYQQRKTAIDKENLQVQNKYLAQISTQINSLVKEYGEKNHYDMIYGATGDGNIMHGNAKLNITEEVIKYINEAVEL